MVSPRGTAYALPGEELKSKQYRRILKPFWALERAGEILLPLDGGGSVLQRSGGILRNELAKLTGLRDPVICGRVDELLEIGVLYEGGKRPSKTTGVHGKTLHLVKNDRGSVIQHELGRWT